MSPVHRRSSLARGRVSARRRTQWATSQITVPLAAAAGTAIAAVDVLATVNVAGFGLAGSTVGRVHVRVNQVSATADTQPGFQWGLVVWDRTAASVKPNAGSDFAVPWLHWAYAVPSTKGPLSDVAFPIFFSDDADVRAKRKLGQMNDSLFLCFTNTGSAAATITYQVRTLLMLP
jgi:hypothetical protein